MKALYPTYYPYPGQKLACVKRGEWVDSAGVNFSGPKNSEIVIVKSIRFAADQGCFLILEGYDKADLVLRRLNAFNARAFLPVELYHAELNNRLEKELLSDCLMNRME